MIAYLADAQWSAPPYHIAGADGRPRCGATPWSARGWQVLIPMPQPSTHVCAACRRLASLQEDDRGHQASA